MNTGLRTARFRTWCLSGLAVVLAACSSGPSTPPARPVIIPETTRVADAATRAALRAYDPQSGTLTFTPAPTAQGQPDGAATLADVAAGDVLASEPSAAAPSGYLRRVTAIRHSGPSTVLETTQANLTDAITQGDLQAEFDLTGDDLVRTTDLPAGVTAPSCR